MATEQDINRILSDIQRIKNDISKTISDILFITNKNAIRALTSSGEDSKTIVELGSNIEELQNVIDILRDDLIPKYGRLLQRVKDSELIWIKYRDPQDKKGPGEQGNFIWFLSKQKEPAASGPIYLRIDLVRFEIDTSVTPFTFTITGQRTGWLPDTWANYEDVEAQFANNSHRYVWSPDLENKQLTIWEIQEELQIDEQDPFGTGVSGQYFLAHSKEVKDLEDEMEPPEIDHKEHELVNLITGWNALTNIDTSVGALTERSATTIDYTGTNNSVVAIGNRSKFFSYLGITETEDFNIAMTISYEKIGAPELIDQTDTLLSVEYLYIGSGGQLKYDAILHSQVVGETIVPMRMIATYSDLKNTTHSTAGSQTFTQDERLEVETLDSNGVFRYAWTGTSFSSVTGIVTTGSVSYVSNGPNPPSEFFSGWIFSDKRGITTKWMLAESDVISNFVTVQYREPTWWTLSKYYTNTELVQSQALMWSSFIHYLENNAVIDPNDPVCFPSGYVIGRTCGPGDTDRLTSKPQSGCPIFGMIKGPMRNVLGWGYNRVFSLDCDFSGTITAANDSYQGQVVERSGEEPPLEIINRLIPGIMEIPKSSGVLMDTDYMPADGGPYMYHYGADNLMTIASLVGFGNYQDCLIPGTQTYANTLAYTTLFESSEEEAIDAETVIVRTPQDETPIIKDYVLAGGCRENALISPPTMQTASMSSDGHVVIARLVSLDSSEPDRILRDFGQSSVLINSIVDGNGVPINSNLGGIKVNKVFLGNLRGFYLTTPNLNFFAKLGQILDSTELSGDLKVDAVNTVAVPGFNISGVRKTMDMIDI